MSTVFGINNEIYGHNKQSRGCFAVRTFKANAGRGAILRLPRGLLPKTNYAEPILVAGFSVQENEAVQFAKSFGGKVFTYAFGHNPLNSVLNVTLYGMLVSGGGPSDVNSYMHSAYRASRIYRAGASVEFLLKYKGVIKGLLVGMSSGTEDPQHGIQKYVMTIALPEVQ